MTDTFSWNLIADLRDMWAVAFMVNAFRAGTIVAVLAAVVGWFMMLDQVRPPSLEMFAPPSLLSIMRSGLSGAIHMSWLSPCGGRRVDQVRPPSIEWRNPTFSA